MNKGEYSKPLISILKKPFLPSKYSPPRVKKRVTFKRKIEDVRYIESNATRRRRASESEISGKSSSPKRRPSLPLPSPPPQPPQPPQLHKNAVFVCGHELANSYLESYPAVVLYNTVPGRYESVYFMRGQYKSNHFLPNTVERQQISDAFKASCRLIM
jgi:hypothetical protein